MRIRALLALGLALAWLALTGSTHASAQLTPVAGYPPATCATLSVSTTTPSAGDTITVSGKNFTPNASVRLELHTTVFVLKTVTADASGSFTTDVTLPAGVTGSHDLVAATGAPNISGCPAEPSQVLDIGGPSASVTGSGGGGGTAFTGVDVLLLLAVAAALVGLGVVINQRGKSAHARRG